MKRYEEFLNEKKFEFKKNDEIGFHGREGKIINIDKKSDSYIVYFSDTGEKDSIDREELEKQNS